MQVRVEHIIDLPANQFFDQLHFNEDFNSRLYDELGFKERVLLEQVERGDTIFRRVKQTPVRDIPGPFQKALRGASLGYEEQTLYHKVKRRADIVIISNIKPDKVNISGTFWIEPDSPDRCKRLFEVDVKVNVFGAGPMAEKLIIADIVKGHDKSADITNRFIREHLRGTLT